MTVRSGEECWAGLRVPSKDPIPGSAEDWAVRQTFPAGASYLAALQRLDGCQERDHIAEENVSNCCGTCPARVQRSGVGSEKNSPKEGRVQYFFFLEFPGEQ